ncbi:MAG: hypothetical protein R2764_11120 [Bacteroidales bacterium]
MRILVFTFLIFVLLAVSCKDDVNCPDKSYQLWLSIYNRTGDDIEVTLYPKQEYLWNDFSYKPGPNTGAHKDRVFIIDYDSLESWSDRNRLYYSPDTSINPSELLSKVFDSITIKVNNENNTELKFFHDYSVNYLENPFTNDSIWYAEKYETHFPNNDCENKAEIKEYIYYFEQDKIDNK